MFNRAASRQPIAAFTIPPSPPPDVAKAYEKFNRIGDERGRLRGELDDAKGALVTADRTSVRAAADAIAAGKPLKDPDRARREVEARIGGLQRHIQAAAVAVDEAGNELAASIVANRSVWLEDLSDAEAEAVARFDRAIADARGALAIVGPARQAVQWIAGFDEGRAVAGQEPQFGGGRIRVDTTLIRRETEGDPGQLLDTLEKVTGSPEPPRRTRGLNVAAPKGPPVAA